MTNRSNLYWTNKTMKVVMELSIAMAWEGKRIEEARKKSGKEKTEDVPAGEKEEKRASKTATSKK